MWVCYLGIDNEELAILTMVTKRAPRNRYKDTLKRSVTTCNIDHCQWTTQPTNRTNCHGDTQSTKPPFPLKPHEEQTWKTKGKGGKTGNLLASTLNSRCDNCPSRIGFISIPAPDEDFFLPESSYAKQSHMMI